MFALTCRSDECLLGPLGAALTILWLDVFHLFAGSTRRALCPTQMFAPFPTRLAPATHLGVYRYRHIAASYGGDLHVPPAVDGPPFADGKQERG